MPALRFACFVCCVYFVVTIYFDGRNGGRIHGHTHDA
jgi:hypothetical protein